MNIIKITRVVLACAIAMVLAGSCRQQTIMDTAITSCGVESFSTQGLRKVDAVLLVGVNNPSKAFTLTNISAVVNNNGREIAIVTADDITVEKKCEKTYRLPLSVNLTGMTALGLLPLLNQNDFSDYGVEVQADLTRGLVKGKTMKYVINGEELKQMLQL